jgi:hypothetical protein
VGGEAMIQYLARILDIIINKATIPSDWKKTIVVLIYKGVTDGWSQITDPLVQPQWPVCKWNVLLHCTRKKIRDERDLLFEVEHGFRSGYSYESQVITVGQDIADPLNNGGRIEVII